MAIIPHEYPVVVDAIHATFLCGLLVSYIYYKRTNVSVGGSLAVGYLAAALISPLTVLFTIVAAFAAYLIIKYVVLKIWLPRPRQIFGIGLLVGIVLGAIWLVINSLLFDDDSVYSNLSIVGVIIPGMLCNSLIKQGIKRTVVPMVWMIPLAAVMGIAIAFLMKVIPGASLSEYLFEPGGVSTGVLFTFSAVSVLAAVVIQEGPWAQHNLRTGGYVTVGMLLAALTHWPYVLMILGVAVALWLLGTAMSKSVALHGKDRFLVLILSSAVLTTLVEFAIVAVAGTRLDGVQNLVMIVLPAIIANDLIQHGPKRTGIGMGISAVATALIGSALTALM